VNHVPRGAVLARARRFGRRGAAATAVAVAICVTLAGTPSAIAAVARANAPATPTTSAAAAAPGDPGTRLVLTGQDAWTVVGGTLTLRLQISANAPVPAADSIAFTAHSSFTSRAAFLGSFASSGSQLGSTLGVVTVPVATLHPDSTGSVSVPIGLQDPNLPRDTNRLPLRRTGVYPVEIELRDASDRGIEGTRFVTQAVVVAPGSNGAPPIAKRLQVAWVWPLVDGPSRRADDSIDPKVLADLQPDGRLGRQVAALGHANGVPVTLVPSPETLEAWAGLARTDPALAAPVRTLQDALTTNEVISGPYVPIDMGSLLDHNLSGAVDTELSRGQAALNTFFGVHIDTDTAFARPASGSALSRLRNGNVDRVVVDESAFVAPSRPERFTRADPFLVQTTTLFSSNSLDALATDDALGRLLTGDAPAAMRAQRLLAGLSLVALEQPTVGRAVVIANPNDFDPASALLDSVFAGLANNPLLQPSTVKAVFDSLPIPLAGSPSAAPRTLAPTVNPSPMVSPADYFKAEVRLAAFQNLVGPSDSRIARGDRALLVSVSDAWKGSAGRSRARRELSVIDRSVDAFVADIHLPNPSTITLTSRAGEVPLTFRNDTGRPVRVRVALASDKLAFPQGSVHDVDLGTKSTTVRVSVRARTSGTFPLRVTVTSVDGGLAISDTRFRIRSTAVSTVGIALMVGAVLFLAAWWGFDIRRRRRRRRTAAVIATA
jgi:hypothetical protein